MSRRDSVPSPLPLSRWERGSRGRGRVARSPSKWDCRGGSASDGFALVELLVALAIFAVIGAIAYQGLATVARAREIVGLESARLADAQFSIALLERDLRQSIARTVRGGYGETLPALEGGRERIELTSLAFASPQGGARAQLARVAWTRTEQGLARVAWSALDRAPNARAEQRVLAPGATSMRLRYLDASQRWLDAWPPQPQRDHLERLPRAVELTLAFEGIGELRRLVDLVEPDGVPPP